MEANQKDINKNIDKAFQSSFDLKSNLAQIWNKIQIPINFLINIHCGRKSLTGNQYGPVTGFNKHYPSYYWDQSLIQNSFMARNLPYQVNGNIPDLKITSRLDSDFKISLGLDVPFTSINEIAKQQLVGYQYNQGKYKLEVKDIFLFGSVINLWLR